MFINNSCPTNGAGASGGVLVNCSVISNRAEKSGGGTYAAAVTNCVLQGNVALTHGGGAYGGSLYGCVVSNNTASVSGGGINSATVSKCVITDNECALISTGYGGGAYDSELENCLIYGNCATEGAGGGASRSVCRNCTIYDNRCGYNSGGTHAWLVDGVSVSTNYNCIVYGNSAGTSDNNIDSRMASFNSFTGNPRFVDAANGDFRLLGDSPCIDMGNNRYVSGETDVRGNARIQNGIVDIGAYEFTLPTGLGNVPVEGTDAAVPVEWLGAYGCVDEDSTPASFQQVMAQAGDNGMPLWQSWVAGFDPWDPDSQLLADIHVGADGEVEVSWMPDLSNAEPKRHYTVMGKTNLTDTAWVIPVNEENPTQEELEEYERALAVWQSMDLQEIPDYTLDVEEAIRLLEESGWTMDRDGGPYKTGIRHKRTEDGQLISLELWIAIPENMREISVLCCHQYITPHHTCQAPLC